MIKTVDYIVYFYIDGKVCDMTTIKASSPRYAILNALKAGRMPVFADQAKAVKK